MAIVNQGHKEKALSQKGETMQAESPSDEKGNYCRYRIGCMGTAKHKVDGRDACAPCWKVAFGPSPY